MPNNLVKSNYLGSITLEKSKLYFWQQLRAQSKNSINKFSFVNTGQWIILLLTNIISIAFVLISCVWIS